MSPFSPKIESATQYIQGPYLAGHGDPNQNPTPRYHVWWWNNFQMKHNDETWSHLPWLITWNLRAAKPMWHVPGSTSHTQIQSISEKDSPSSAPPKNSSLEKQRRWHNIVVDAYLLQMELRSGTHGTMITPFKKAAGGRYWNPEMARFGMVSYWVYHKQPTPKPSDLPILSHGQLIFPRFGKSSHVLRHIQRSPTWLGRQDQFGNLILSRRTCDFQKKPRDWSTFMVFLETCWKNSGQFHQDDSNPSSRKQCWIPAHTQMHLSALHLRLPHGDAHHDWHRPHCDGPAVKGAGKTAARLLSGWYMLISSNNGLSSWLNKESPWMWT